MGVLSTNSNALAGIPIPVTQSSVMAEYAVNAFIGCVLRFDGTTDTNYTNGALYMVVVD